MIKILHRKVNELVQFHELRVMYPSAELIQEKETYVVVSSIYTLCAFNFLFS